MGAPRVTVWSRFGSYIGELTGITGFVHKAKINGEDSVTITCAGECVATKGTYLLWLDVDGIWHESIVKNISQSHASSPWKIYAVSSITELAQDYVTDLRPGVRRPVGAAEALAVVLDGTRWGVGSVDVAGTSGTSIYHVSVYEALSKIIEHWGGEVAAEITVDPSTGVTARNVALRDHLGHVTPQRRLEFGHDLGGITRTVDDASPITACYAWGKGEQLDSGGYGRRIGIDSVTPDGLPYVHDDSLLTTWGIPGPDGTPVHRFGELVDGNCEDPQKLLAKVQDYLDKHSQPTVSYKGDVGAYADVGADVDGLHLGDELQIADGGLGIRVQARAIEITRDYIDRSKTRVTLGNFLGSLVDQFGQLKADVSGLLTKASAWDVVGDAGSTYVDQVISTLNAMFAASGGFLSFDTATGLTVMDAADFDTATKAINICGAGFRIANSKSGTEWVWRTFGTGDGFIADRIIAGILTAVLIQSATDPDHNYLDLQTGVGQWNKLIVGKVGTSDANYATIGDDDVAYFDSQDGATFRTTGSGVICYRNGKKTFEIIADGYYGTFIQSFDANGANVTQQIYLPSSGSPTISLGSLSFSVDAGGMTVREWEASAGGTGTSKYTTIPPGYTLGYVHRLVNPNGEHFWTISATEAANLISVGWTEEANAGFYAFVKN